MNYEKYLSDDKVTFTSREYYTDSSGYQNEKAFWDFVKDATEADRMYLMCIDIDLSPSNAKGTGFGDLVMRTFFTKIRELFPIFRMRGTKFNLFIPENEIDTIQEIVASDGNNNYFIIHGYIVKDKFVSSENIKEVLAEGVKGMLGDRKDDDAVDAVIENADDAVTRNTDNTVIENINNAVIENVDNAPAMQQETSTKKYIAEMWFAEITFTEIAPNPRTLKAYVYPTEYQKPMAMLHSIVVLDDMIQPRLYSGTVARIPIDGMRITISVRYDHDGHMIVAWAKSTDSVGEIRGDIELHEGNSIPANYGKRIGSTKEIYPIKMNSQGLYEYVLYDKKTQNVEYVTEGIIKGKNDSYEVHRDSEVIQLVKI